MPAVQQSTAVGRVQRRTVVTLALSQALGGVGVSTGIAVSAIIAEEIVGSATLAGLTSTTQVLGAALAAYAIAALARRGGRRTGLAIGYTVGAFGAALSVVAAASASFLLLLLGTALLGSATAASSQARFAAADLAEPHSRGRALSIVVWATTVGAVLGPNVVGPAGDVAVRLELPAASGAYLLGVLGTGAAAAYLVVRLRPDPLLLARELERAQQVTDDVPPPTPMIEPVRHVVRRHPRVLAGVVVIACAHASMVAVMGMTPLHMDHGGASLQVVGFVISVHILGMYAFSPLVGWLTDRRGQRVVLALGSLLLLLAVVLAGTTQEGSSARLTAGLFLLGLGWTCVLVAGSTLVGEGLDTVVRPRVQGFADLVMGLSAASAGALSGVVVGVWGFGTLNAAAAMFAVAIAVVVAVLPRPVAVPRRGLPGSPGKPHCPWVATHGK